MHIVGIASETAPLPTTAVQREGRVELGPRSFIIHHLESRRVRASSQMLQRGVRPMIQTKLRQNHKNHTTVVTAICSNLDDVSWQATVWQECGKFIFRLVVYSLAAQEDSLHPCTSGPEETAHTQKVIKLRVRKNRSRLVERMPSFRRRR